VVANRGTSEVLAIGTVKEPAYEWRPERSEYRHTVAVDWDLSFAQVLDPPVSQWATTTVLPVPRELERRILGHHRGLPAPTLAGPSSGFGDLEEGEFRAWAAVLERKKQLIFYGPPGTGKTRAARRFSRWWLARARGLDLASFPDEGALDRHLEDPGFCARAWWVTANPAEWSWQQMLREGHVSYRRGKVARHYEQVRPGDIVVCYEASPMRRVVGLARVVACHHDQPGDAEPLRLLPLRQFAAGPNWDQLESDDALSRSEPVKNHAQGTLFALTPPELRRLLDLAGIGEDYLNKAAGDIVGPLTQLTFHASYAYEEFIEGYRPVADAGPGLTLELRDGLMKRVCRTASADRPQPYMLLIDELNRANVPRVFGELITVLEADKRGTSVVLPASGSALSVPESVYIIGTMNTADRSIRSLDAALRRRFAFIELMPRPELLEGTVIDDLALDLFLAELNRRISGTAGRERQIGHSFFLSGEHPIQDADALAEVLRLEIIPLLQEIAYDDYGQLARYLGTELVDVAEHRLTAVADDPGALVEALTREYGAQPEATG
jgi:5-methylcytosine-specific restriction protein B